MEYKGYTIETGDKIPGSIAGSYSQSSLIYDYSGNTIAASFATDLDTLSSQEKAIRKIDGFFTTQQPVKVGK